MSNLKILKKCGLTNLGNTCYLNTTIQCLTNCDDLTEYFASELFLEDMSRNKNQSLVTFEYAKLVKNLVNTEEGVLKPTPFVSTFTKYNMRSDASVKFMFGRQHDMHEFLVYLLDIFHTSLEEEVEVKINGTPKNDYDVLKLDAVKSWAGFIEKQYSKLIELFFGLYIVETYNNDTGDFISRKFDAFNNITLELLDVSTKFVSTSLYDSLKHHCKEEILDGDNKYYDEDNKEYVNGKRIATFWKLPKYLIINLKRFKNNSRKIDTVIDFPIDNLDMSAYCPLNPREKSKYKLISIGNHIGGSSNGGHYYAINRNSNDEWIIHNDASVRTLEFSDMEELKKKIVTKNVYLLIYVRKK
jgi:ubiquitin C-terminal hydrolase